MKSLRSRKCFRPVFWLCCCCVSFARTPLENTPHLTVWGWQLPVWSLLHTSWPLNAKRPPKPSTHNPSFPDFPKTTHQLPTAGVLHLLELIVWNGCDQFWRPRRRRTQWNFGVTLRAEEEINRNIGAVNDCYCHVIPLFKKAAWCPSKISHTTPTCLLHIKRILIAEHRHAI